MLTTLIAALVATTVQAPQTERFPDFPEQDALSYAIDLLVNLEQGTLRGSVDYRIRTIATQTKLRLHARRSEQYTVQFSDLEDRPLSAEWEGDQVTITLPRPVEAGAIAEFRATMVGAPVDGFYFRENRYGQRLAFTDHYSIRARGWLPCEDHPNDRATWQVQLSYPENAEVVGYGVKAKAGATDLPVGYDAAYLHSKAEIAPYMLALVIGPFARVAEGGDDRLQPHYVYEQDVAKAKLALVHHGRWLQAMETAFGPYPYSKYTTVQCPTRWGGFEAPGNVLLAESLFDRPDHGVSTLAHEMVHMWFGDAVGYARWREVWLSEGFASYFGPWLHAQTGGPSLQHSLAAMRTRWLRSYVGRTKTIRDDGFAHPDRALNANTYPKGAWVLHMLRDELGDELFFKALREYFRRNSGRSVLTSDFVEVVEAVADRDLSGFFEQWLDRIGCPEIEVTTGDRRIVVRQLQNGAPYRFWLSLRWVEGGTTKQRRLRVDGPRVELELESNRPVSQLEVDPEVELLFRPR